ncbi:MAG TPA: hypothetical protein VII58_11990 [Acidobacteriaceae bacterium]
MEPINEMIERFLVALGLTLSRLSEEEMGMVTMLLLFLVVAAVASRALRMAHFGQ